MKWYSLVLFLLVCSLTIARHHRNNHRHRHMKHERHRQLGRGRSFWKDRGPRVFNEGFNWFRKRSAEPVDNKPETIKCTYNRSVSLLSCKAPNKTVECEAKIDLSFISDKTVNFELAKNSETKSRTLPIDNQVFSLFSKGFEWLSNKMDNMSHVDLFFKTIGDLFGLKLTDLGCFKELSGFALTSIESS